MMMNLWKPREHSFSIQASLLTTKELEHSLKSWGTQVILFIHLFQRASRSPIATDQRSRSPLEAKKMKKEDEDGDRSDQDLVVDDSNDAVGAPASSSSTRPGKTTSNGSASGSMATNGNRSPKENGSDCGKKDPHSPNSARSTPASIGKKDDKALSASPGVGQAKMSPPVSKALAGLGKKSFGSWQALPFVGGCIPIPTSFSAESDRASFIDPLFSFVPTHRLSVPWWYSASRSF